MSGLVLVKLVHVAISLVGIAAGLVCLLDMLGSRLRRGWTATFLAATVATSVTGFFFPFVQLLPSHITGVISLVVLTPTFYALYRGHLAGWWRPVYVSGAIFALYLNCFVLVVQLFLKVPSLHALAPTQREPPFVGAQAALLLVMVICGLLSLRRFRPTGFA